MIAEILSTGDEVLLGDIFDTNSGFLCEKLKEMGIPVRQITAVGDKVTDISIALKEIAKRADICLVTGGLGPTQDDLTALACASAAEEKLLLNQEAFTSMATYFAKRGFEITQENKKQARLPESANVLINNQGTAPGFSISMEHCSFFFMPGVPSEMKAMFEAQVKPRIMKIQGSCQKIPIERLTVFGLPESRVGSLLKGFENKFFGMRLGFRAEFPLIEVKIVFPQADGFSGNPGDQMQAAKKWVVQRLENKVISLSGKNLQEEVGRILRQKKLTIAIAESCTGGLISNLMTDVAGSSDYFLFSGVTYSNEAKVNILKVDIKTLETYGAVHELTALEMARGAKKMGRADWAISTTGIAGPSGGTDDKPVGTVCIGVVGPDLETTRQFTFSFGNRARNKEMFAATAMEMLRRQLIE
jgi:nicotinamide-nucleotide amidase